MEKVQILKSPLSYVDCVMFLFSSIILNYTFMALEKFFPKYLAYVHFLICHALSQLQLPITCEKICDYTRIETETTHTHVQDIDIKSKEVGLIMSDLGIHLNQEEDQIKDSMSREEFSTLFDQTEPGLHEIKEAFFIFDKNKDGFIDAKDLQSVLINLGLRDGTGLDACQSMIDQHDRNRDGKIDLTDFFKLMESALL